MWVSYHFRHADYWQSGCYKLSDWSGKQNCQYIFLDVISLAIVWSVHFHIVQVEA